jgi:adenine-specific DNA-methyltransferase
LKKIEKENYKLILGDTLNYLKNCPDHEMFDLVVTSPPYNIGKSYETKKSFPDYIKWQSRIIDKIIPLLKSKGSLCWQVGNFIGKDSIYPLDIAFHEIFCDHGLKLKNRIIWTYGHGLHSKRRFSGRYEVIMWYVKSENYTFNLDDVRVPSKYPNKKYYKGPRKGEISSNPLGKNPEDVWNIPNVKSNHIEKTIHPCQFPVGLIERLILALTNKGDTVFDPFMGVASSGVASIIHGRNFVGTEIDKDFFEIGKKRIEDLLNNDLKYRPHDKPIYNPTENL